MLLVIDLASAAGVTIGVVVEVVFTIGHGSFYLVPYILTLKVSYF